MRKSRTEIRSCNFLYKEIIEKHIIENVAKRKDVRKIIIIGSGISGISYVLQDKITYLTCDDSKKMKYTMLVMFGTSFFLVVLGALIMILHFIADEETFKTVGLAGLGFLGAYLYTTIVYAIIYFGSKKCE